MNFVYACNEITFFLLIDRGNEGLFNSNDVCIR